MKKPLSILSIVSVAALALPLTAVAEGTSPWLPAPGQFALGIAQTYQTADSAYIGGTDMPVNTITTDGTDEYVVNTSSLQVSYGISDYLSIDAVVNYTDVDAGSDDGASDNGLADSTIGLQWRVADEYIYPELPTVSLRAAVIIAGDYDTNTISSLGKGADGFEVSAIVGKQITSKFSVWGEVGHQNRGESVPDSLFYNLNAAVGFTSTLSGSIGFSRKTYSGDLDIGGVGFTPERFPEISEERSLVKIGLNYAFASNQGLSFNLATLTDGKNTVNDDLIASVAYSYGFN